jgi:hypothetical protein
MIQKTIKPKDRQEYINVFRKKLSGRMKNVSQRPSLKPF